MSTANNQSTTIKCLECAAESGHKAWCSLAVTISVNNILEPTESAARGSSPAPFPAKFIIQRPEYPDWWGGWTEQNLPSWTSHPGHAYLVRLDELVDTLTRLKRHHPIAAIYSPNDV
jgi:hypothetical protein